MAGNRFTYNPHTCRYEPYQERGAMLWKKTAFFLVLSFFLALAGYFVSVRHFESPDEIMLSERNDRLKISWSILQGRIRKAQEQLASLIEKDDHNYRVILDSEPLPPSVREAGIGGSEKFDPGPARDFAYIVSGHKAVEKLKNQAVVELQSFDELERILDDKLDAWAARPAIQPISNSDLKRLHLTFGLREHPIFNITREHKGLDFAADPGMPVYATGDGRITMAYSSESYGRVIFVDHGYEYETRYAHLSRFAVSPGDQVRRGQLIGYVGNTGYSVSSHLHYEVIFKGQHVNPINFFQRDLGHDEYQKLIELGSENNISLD